MAATQAQLRTYHWHKQVALFFGYGQSTWKHRHLDGDMGTPTSTGNQLYTSSGPATVDETTTDTLVWAVWRQREPKQSPADDLVMGRTREIRLSGQIPVLDDNGNVITITDEDWLVTGILNQRFKIGNPQISPEEGFWIFEMSVMR